LNHIFMKGSQQYILCRCVLNCEKILQTRKSMLTPLNACDVMHISLSSDPAQLKVYSC
jgi:hypothetical protein